MLRKQLKGGARKAKGRHNFRHQSVPRVHSCTATSAGLHQSPIRTFSMLRLVSDWENRASLSCFTVASSCGKLEGARQHSCTAMPHESCIASDRAPRSSCSETCRPVYSRCSLRKNCTCTGRVRASTAPDGLLHTASILCTNMQGSALKSLPAIHHQI